MAAPLLTAQLVSMRKQKAFAWAKFYEEVRDRLDNDHRLHSTFNRVADDKEIPEHIKAEMKAMALALEKKWECPVCMEMIEHEDLEITNCGHYYCKACLTGWKQRCKDMGEQKWSCGMCNRKHKFADE